MAKTNRALQRSIQGVLLCVAVPGLVQAQDAAAQADAAGLSQSEPLAEVIVTGSRFGGRIAKDSPTPIDSISLSDLAVGGRTELQSMLKEVAPSFSTGRPATGGTSDFTSSPTLRGLSPGQLLMLVNGKRRHTSATVSTGNTIGRGDIDYDFNAVPPAAIGRVEVLRDGAAAQYGSDAIGGVINVMLDNSLGAKVQATGGANSEGDGEAYDVSGALGLPLGAHGGFIRTTLRYLDQNESNRAAPDTRQQYFSSDGTLLPSNFYGSGIGLTPPNGTLDPREATFDRDVFHLGGPEYTMKTVFVNAELPIGSGGATLYSFGGYSDLEGTTFANFFRRPGQDETVRALDPDGFHPINEMRIQNESVTLGVRGEGLAGFTWDLSSTYGGNTADAERIHSANTSYGAASPTRFYLGASELYQWTTTLDLSRQFDIGFAQPLNVAVGFEYRDEEFRRKAGAPDSYLNGGVPILDGPNAGRLAPVGAQPTPGVTPEDAVRGARNSEGAYLELEQQFFDDVLLLSGAVRHERYSDFGDTTNYKFATRIKPTDWLSLRGSFGTGFRAPSLPQSYFSTTTVNFLGGNPVLIRLIRVTDPMSRVVGATDLKPETSRNFSVGAVLDVGMLTLSADFYRVEIEDRIAISSNFQDARVTNLLAQNGYPGIGAAAYLTNAVDTTTTGVDVTAEYRLSLGGAGQLTTTLAANFNESELDRIAGTPEPLAALGITTPLFDLTQQVRFTDSYPRDKVSLRFKWDLEPFSVVLTNTRFGEVANIAFTSITPARAEAVSAGYDVRLVPVSSTSPNYQVIQYFESKILTDLELSYRYNDRLTVSAGANNLFDVYPTRNLPSTSESVAAGTNGADNAGTIIYNPISPFGFTGRYYFFRLGYDF